MTVMTGSSATLITLETDMSDEVRQAVQSGLFAYNARFAGPMDHCVLTISARGDDKKIIGGLIAQLLWKWMHVDRLWVDESHRRKGIGRQLLVAAENEAQNRGCLYSYLNTFDFQARGFYEKHGYSVYAVQENFPVGHKNFLMSKPF
jgi:ribosomal protein S18 acetylase RimI-like enzyme